ncbi:hypothetical protein BGW80DRAFT_1455877 [Lactifluus volemus]|nr:hypothetical protein BGW80DRAFT_1455877 [Lactifluus volemus]
MSAAINSEMTEWRRVHKEIERDIRQLRVEKSIVLDDLHQLQLQREEQRREWEREREAMEERRRGHVPFWGEARLLSTQCPGDRVRQYDAPMYNLLVEDDWHGMCMNTSMTVAGRTLASPHSCINYGLDAGVRGYWSIEVNTRECPRTIWDRVSHAASLDFMVVYLPSLS